MLMQIMMWSSCKFFNFKLSEECGTDTTLLCFRRGRLTALESKIDLIKETQVQMQEALKEMFNIFHRPSEASPTVTLSSHSDYSSPTATIGQSSFVPGAKIANAAVVDSVDFADLLCDSDSSFSSSNDFSYAHQGNEVVLAQGNRSSLLERKR